MSRLTTIAANAEGLFFSNARAKLLPSQISPDWLAGWWEARTINGLNVAIPSNNASVTGSWARLGGLYDLTTGTNKATFYTDAHGNSSNRTAAFQNTLGGCISYINATRTAQLTALGKTSAYALFAAPTFSVVQCVTAYLDSTAINNGGFLGFGSTFSTAAEVGIVFITTPNRILLTTSTNFGPALTGSSNYPTSILANAQNTWTRVFMIISLRRTEAAQYVFKEHVIGLSITGTVTGDPWPAGGANMSFNFQSPSPGSARITPTMMHGACLHWNDIGAEGVDLIANYFYSQYANSYAF
jgi:hypothetical protein